MPNMPSDFEPGQTVWLYPSTKTASNACHRRLQVKIVNPDKHWPMVVVDWKEDGKNRWELVHKQNIRTRRPDARVKSEEKEGDTTRDGGGMSRWAQVRKMPGASPVHIEQEGLF